MSHSQNTPINESPVFSADPGNVPIVTPPPPQLNFGPGPSRQPQTAAKEANPGVLPPGKDEHPQPAADIELDVLKQLRQATGSDNTEAVPAVSKDDLAKILEGFAQVLRGDEQKVQAVNVKHDAELVQLKELLLDAQGTIISLLNDRVFDRAKIARLEAEVRLMPDLQAQVTRAMGLALRSEEVQKDISNIKTEVERLRTSYVRSDRGSDWISKLFGR